MRTIIACTDFSPQANNAVQYAAALANAAKARLVLFHYHNYPIPATDLQGMFPADFQEKVVDDLENKLEHVKLSLTKTYPIEVSSVVRSLDFHLDLQATYHAEHGELVVMGMQGQSALVNALLGNVTSSAIRRGKMPILVVPHTAVFHPIKKILFSCDDHETHPHILRALRDLAHVFDAYIEVLTLFDLEKTPALAPNGTLSPAKSNLEFMLAGTRHGYSFENEDAVDKGILYEAMRSTADMVAMIPHHHTFLSTLLNQSETQRIAAVITLPLLVLGEMAQRTAEEAIQAM